MPQYFTFHSSRYLALAVVLSHLLVAGTFLFLPVPPIALLLLLLMLAASMSYYLLNGVGRAWVALRLEHDSVVLINRKGEESVGKLLRSSVVMPYLVVLHIAIPDQRNKCNVVLMPDSMEPASFRKLRVALKWDARATI